MSGWRERAGAPPNGPGQRPDQAARFFAERGLTGACRSSMAIGNNSRDGMDPHVVFFVPSTKRPRRAEKRGVVGGKLTTRKPQRMNIIDAFLVVIGAELLTGSRPARHFLASSIDGMRRPRLCEWAAGLATRLCQHGALICNAN